MLMKKLLILLCLLPFLCLAQPGYITTIAGNYAAGSGYSGDGGPATAAQLFDPLGLIKDNYGNLYIAEWGNRVIRKVDVYGIITTVAGTGTEGHSGDGGAATAGLVSDMYQLAMDATGSLYFCAVGRCYVRQISPSGIITTIAG